MAATQAKEQQSETPASAWHGFQPGLWQGAINVRDFIQQNYRPYEGDESLLRSATPRTQALRARC